MASDKKDQERTPMSSQAPSPTPPWKVLTAGGVAGAVSRTCTSPLERLKIMFQIQRMGGQQTKYNGILGSLYKMIAEEGIAGFFKGNGTNCIRIAPYSAVQFYTFESVKTFAREHQISNPMMGSFAAGGIAGVTALVTTYPLDLIRTRLTIQTTENKYRGIKHTLTTVMKEEGVLALYKGVGTSSMGIFPYSAINFMVYDTLKRHLVKDNRKVGVVESLAYGGIAGAVAQTITYPVDLLRRRMQLQGAGGAPRLYNGPIDAVRKIIKQEGVTGLYQGMIPCYLKVIPSIAISFCTYEVMRRILGIEQKTNFGAG